jgi:hypothetical protein
LRDGDFAKSPQQPDRNPGPESPTLLPERLSQELPAVFSTILAGLILPSSILPSSILPSSILPSSILYSLGHETKLAEPPDRLLGRAMLVFTVQHPCVTVKT